MAKVPTFYSVNETSKSPLHRIHHNDNTCASGRDIPLNERRPGTGGYRLCQNCQNR